MNSVDISRSDSVSTHDSEVLAQQRCGIIAIVGRPNVGKSTLLNALVGQKVSITSRKAQTTRHRITGVCTIDWNQFVFIDTPGFQSEHNKALNQSLNKAVVGALHDVDMVFWVLEAGRFTEQDERVMRLLQDNAKVSCPTLLIANKIDLVRNREQLLPWLQSMQTRFQGAEYFPMNAKSPKDTKRLLELAVNYLPQQEWFYDPQTLTDKSERFLASEVVREKLFRLTGDELPYSCTVQIESFDEEPSARHDRFIRIHARIVADKANHKAMVVGDKGERIKRIGSEARSELEKYLQAKVHLELWVQVRSGWADDQMKLRSYGYE